MAKPKYLVRDAVNEDMTGMIDLWNLMMIEHEAFDPRIRLARGAEGAYQAYLGYHLGNEESIVTVAAEEGEAAVCGFCLAAINRNLPMFLPARYGYLSDLVVHPDARRSGIGRALVHATSDWFKTKDIDSIQLQVYSRNEAAAVFWKSMGFDPFYERMWLDLE